MCKEGLAKRKERKKVNQKKNELVYYSMRFVDIFNKSVDYS